MSIDRKEKKKTLKMISFSESEFALGRYRLNDLPKEAR